MKIVAFLQNPWHLAKVSEGEQVLYREDQQFHKVMLSRSATGRRLVMAFGTNLFNEVWWDNVAPKSGATSQHITKVNRQHVDGIIKREKPDLILAFGTLAGNTLKASTAGLVIPQLHFPHPMKHGLTQSEIDACAMQVREAIMDYDRRYEKQ